MEDFFFKFFVWLNNYKGEGGIGIKKWVRCGQARVWRILSNTQCSLSHHVSRTSRLFLFLFLMF